MVEVVSPQSSYFVLASHVPHSEADALARGHSLHVKSNGGNRAHVFVQFDLVEDGSFTCKATSANHLSLTRVMIGYVQYIVI